MAALELRTFADIYKAVAEELKIQISDTTTIDRIKRDINIIYLDEVLPANDWYWARKPLKLISKKHINTGSVSVTKGDTQVTLSAAPDASTSYAGMAFATDGYLESYVIKAHVNGSTTITLDSPYQGETNATLSYKIWEDGLALPSDADEVYEVYHDHHGAAMDSIGNLQFTELVLNSPRREGRPRWYSVDDYYDPITFSAISGLPAISTRESDGYVRTITFSTDITGIIEEGELILIQESTDLYNGEYLVDSVDGATLSYVHIKYLDEVATADLNMEILGSDRARSTETYRKLKVYPYLNKENTTLKIEYIKKVEPLDADSDEPILPVRDRVALLYGALERAWGRIRNPEESVRNGRKYQEKIAKMAGNMQNSMDMPIIKVGANYKVAKRNSFRRRYSKWRDF